jgi:hypothetical protein
MEKFCLIGKKQLKNRWKKLKWMIISKNATVKAVVKIYTNANED